MPTEIKITPMLQQYLEIKAKYNDAILFYRMGDFYEMFFEDAVIASKILNITLTSRSHKNDSTRIPMCGIPYHAVQGYLAKMVRAGQRVAICEQMENPEDAKGIVQREVIRVVSPGLLTDSFLLDEKNNNYLAALCSHTLGKSIVYGLSFLDVSTGEFLVGEYPAKSDGEKAVLDQLSRLTPAELLVADNTDGHANLLATARVLLPGLCCTERPATLFHRQSMVNLLQRHFGVLSLDGFGCGGMRAGLIAAGVLLDYSLETQKTHATHIERLTPLEFSDYLQIDDASRRNLELTQTIVGGNRDGSLLAVLDHTTTPMGARLLKHNLLFPLQDVTRITARLDAVEYFVEQGQVRLELRQLLERIYDLERLNSRVTLGSANGRDLLAMQQSLAQLPAIQLQLASCSVPALRHLTDTLDCLPEIQSLLAAAIHPEAPLGLRDGNLIQPGFNAELDALNLLLRNGKSAMLQMENSERQASGIAKLKIGYNKVFGYYLEVSKAQASQVPAHYIRKQTLVNAERFITPELKEFENQVVGAEDRRLQLEYELFCQIRSTVAQESSRILHTARTLAKLDFLSTLAEVAQRYAYCRPAVNDGTTITISEGRHPVIERSLPSGSFVPNDLHLNQQDQEVLIITGPNMAGKSTVLRQTALIVLLAQMGSFVPAAQATIGLVDRIFTRVGAMDDLRRGQSTFMVEMSETANILHNATERSLVILDEIGRGTSTYDGLAIAWAVVEELVRKNEIGVKTLFATHYHELTDLAVTEDRIQNFSIAVREWQDSILFLHKLVSGATNRSYGIQVAALAGVPEQVVVRAKEILANIEHSEFDGCGQPAIAQTRFPRKTKKKHPNQLNLFTPPADPLRDYLQALDVNEVSPKKALEILYDLKKFIQ